MNKTLFFLAFFFACSFGSFAQEMKITGVVHDSTGTAPLPNTIAMAVRVKDSLLLGFTRSDENGKFTMPKFPVDTFQLIFDHPDYDDKSYFIFGHSENDEIHIPSVKMPTKTQQLEGVVIYANKNPIYYNGDTLVYVADSFNVHQNAVAEDLLKKLPGIEVDKDGKIKAQGEDVAKVLVDGDEFFGSDPTVATKNLGAEGIESVQIYEQEDENSDNDEKVKVLDLKMKDEFKKGYFGRISGASDFSLTPINGKVGTNPFYEGELLLNRFNGDMKVSVFGLITNTPKANFGWGDANKFGLDNENAGQFWEDRTQNSSGIPETLKTGFYYRNKLGKKKNTEIGLNYSYYNTRLNSYSASQTQLLTGDSTFITDDSTHSFSQTQTHRVFFDLESKLDKFTTIYFEPSFKYDLQNKNSSDITQYLKRDGTQTLNTTIGNENKSKGLRLDADFGIERKFKKKKRLLEFDYEFRYNNNDTRSKLLSRTLQMINPAFNDTIDQSKDNLNNDMMNRAELTYNEPLSKKWRIELRYRYTNQQGNQNLNTNSFDGTNYTIFEPIYSNKFKNNRNEHLGGVKFKFESKKHKIQLGANLRNIDIVNNNLISNSDIKQNITSVLPNFQYRFKPSRSTGLNVNYRTYSSAPSLSALQPVLNNSNPNSIRVGNPDLKPNYVHNMNVHFNSWNALSGSYTYAGLWASYTQDGFVNANAYDSLGRNISKTVNEDGNANLNLYAGGKYFVFKRIISLRPNLNVGYNRYTSFVNTKRNTTNNLHLGGELKLGFEWDSLNIEIVGGYTQNLPSSSISSFANAPYSTQRYGIEFEWQLPKGFRIETDATYTINSNRAAGFNAKPLIWNAEISKSFLKTENLVLSVIARDILNQNINNQRTVTGNSITDNRTQLISRYFLLKLTWRFNNNKTKETDDEGFF